MLGNGLGSRPSSFFLQGELFGFSSNVCYSTLRPLSPSEDAGIEPRIVATMALTARRSNHLARFHFHTWLDPIEFYLPFELAVFVKINLFPFPLVKGKVGFAPHCLFAKKIAYLIWLLPAKKEISFNAKTVCSNSK
jgi:hypothetical protein